MNESQPTEIIIRDFPKLEHYEVLSELGRGGMGVVYEARQTNLNRRVAIKMVLAGEHASHTARARFLQEAEIAARLHHPNIVQIFELGDHQGLPFFVMENVEGGSLPRRVAKSAEDYKHLTILFQKLARAVHHAHSQGIIHRDLKPGNILMTPDGEPKITDFGLAKLMDPPSDKSALTYTGAIMGTPAYMAPEQALGELSIGPQTDIYALGVMLYEQMAGEVPFHGDSEMEVLRRIAHDEPTSPAWKNPSLPRNLEIICMKCLRKKAQDRYHTAEDLAADLGRFLAGDPIKARPVGKLYKMFYWCRRHPWKVALVLGALAGLTGGGLWWRHQYLYQWECSEYFGTFLQRWGTYEGLGRKLTPEQARKRAQCYRLVRQGIRGHVLRMESVDSTGKINPATNTAATTAAMLGLMPTSSQECRYELAYNPDGTLKEERVLTLDGGIVRRLEYSYPEALPGQKPMARCRIRFISPEAVSLPSVTGVAQLEFTRDDSGMDLSLRCLNARGAPQAAAANIYGLAVTHDERCRPLSLQCLDEAGNPTNNSEGWSQFRFKTNDDDLLIELAVFDVSGRPASWQGHHRIVQDYDANGNLSHAQFFDKENTQTSAADQQYDDKGRSVFARHVLTGKEAAETRWTWASDGGFVRSVHYLDAEGNPKPGQQGSAKERYFMDAKGRMVRYEYAEFVGVNYHQIVGIKEWNGDQLKSQTVWLEDKEGKRVRHEDGYMEAREEYDAKGHVVVESYHGYDGSPAYPYFKEVISFAWNEGSSSKAGALFSYFDKEDKPVRHEEGFISNRDEYDDKGRILREIYNGWSEEVHPYFTSVVENDWQDSKGEEPKFKTSKYLDKDGKPVRTEAGYLSQKQELDESGKIVRETFIGYDPAKFPYHAAITVNSWDEQDSDTPSRTIIYYQGADGRPARNEFGAQETEMVKTSDGRVTQWMRGCDPDKWPSSNLKVIEEKNAGGVTTSRHVTLLDANDKPATSSQGISSFYQELDAEGRITRQRNLGYGSSGLPYEEWIQHFSYGEGPTAILLRSTWQDAQGKPARNECGALEMTIKRNADKTTTVLLAEIDEATWGFASIETLQGEDGKVLREHHRKRDGREAGRIETVVVRIFPNSQAARMGLQKGDVLVSYAGVEVASAQYLYQNMPKSGGSVTIRRGGKTMEISGFEPGFLGIVLADRVAK